MGWKLHLLHSFQRQKQSAALSTLPVQHWNHITLTKFVHQTVNSQFFPEGHCSYIHPLLASLTFSYRYGLFDENFSLFQWFFHLPYNWNKIEHVIYTQTLCFFTTFFFFTLCNLSSASILPLKLLTSLLHLLCNLFSNLMLFPFISSCNSLLILLLPLSLPRPHVHTIL